MRKLDKSKLVFNMSKKQKLAPYIDKVFASFDEPFTFTHEPKQGDDAWHPSGDCTPSPLQLFLKANMYLEDETTEGIISESLRKSFMVGHYWHQLLQYIVLEKLEFCTADAIERRGKKIWKWDQGLTEMCQCGHPKTDHLNVSQSWDCIPGCKCYWYEDVGTKPRPFHWATGSGDLAPCVLPRGWEGVVDFKTMNSNSFKSTEVPFADKYECQMNIYMDFFDLEHALILGIQKDSPHSFKEFEFHRNQPLIDMIYSKWEFVSECVSNGEVPDEEDHFVLPLAGPVVL